MACANSPFSFTKFPRNKLPNCLFQVGDNPFPSHHTARVSLLYAHSCFLGQLNTQVRGGTVLRVHLILKSTDCFRSKE